MEIPSNFNFEAGGEYPRPLNNIANMEGFDRTFKNILRLITEFQRLQLLNPFSDLVESRLHQTLHREMVQTSHGIGGDGKLPEKSPPSSSYSLAYLFLLRLNDYVSHIDYVNSKPNALNRKTRRRRLRRPRGDEKMYIRVAKLRTTEGSFLVQINTPVEASTGDSSLRTVEITLGRSVLRRGPEVGTGRAIS